MACTCDGHTTTGPCTGHDNTGGCNGHDNTGGCNGHTTTSGCTGHDNTGGCNGHTTTGGCTSHDNSCSSYSGYVPATTITFTNEDVTPGEEIDALDEIHELLTKLNDESNRRAALNESTPISLTLTDPLASSQIRQIRDLYLDILNTTASTPITDTEIAVGQQLRADTIETMKDGIISDSASCVCDCNYACTCDCNYACTCDCNYACTCDCNYACTCDCNYACTCDCNYSCTCNCNYSCTCVCNYSDERLKTNIIYI